MPLNVLHSPKVWVAALVLKIKLHSMALAAKCRRSPKPTPATTPSAASTPAPRRPHAPEVAARFGQPGRVADRIRAINSLQQLPSIKAEKPKEPDTSLVLPINPPHADELHRASPFPRRDSAQSPIRPDTPLSQSQPPVSPLVHCPMPKRYQPQLSANIEKGAIPTINFDQSMCYRHGRKLQSITSFPAGTNKVFSDAYITIAPMIRQQVDPLSPWSVGNRLAKTSGTTVSPDACPDCLAEKNILKRETEITIRTPQVQPNHHVRSASSSIFTERGTPPDSTQSSNVLVGTTIDNQTIKIPGATISDLPPDKFGGVVATDLGDLIDAIIVEHSGSLGKVISNIRNGMPDSAWTQKLSRDLAKVSEAVASLPKDNIKNAPAFSQNINGRRSVILDASPDTLRKRAKTMPELLDLIDVATEELGTSGSDNRQQDLKLDRPHMPGGFPLSRSTFPSTAPHIPVVRSCDSSASYASSASCESRTSSESSSSSERSVASVSSFPSLQTSGRARSSDTLAVTTRTKVALPVMTTSSTLVERPTPEGDEDKATLVDADLPFSTKNLPEKASQGPNTSGEAPSRLQWSRIPKAMTIPSAGSSHTSSDLPRSTLTRPKANTIDKQQQPRRTFQQEWLREAAVVERAERRSRSRGATRV
ncbi:hypothetical protein E4T42_00549 [Aureobasidium subglaciale]|nr:hypothetical protein E4T42_00549 [Aureobasidium subglaciale]